MNNQARWRTIVTILIGVASLLGALSTWRLTQVAGEAGGADARAIDDTITREQNRSSAQVTARGEATAFARFRGYESAANALEALADQAASTGNVAAAQDLRNTRQTLRELAVDLLDRYGALQDPRYLDDDGATFDAEQRRVDLELNLERVSGVFPAPATAAAHAADAHGHSRDLGLVIFAFALAIFLFALSEKLREHFVMGLAIGGVGLLTVATLGLLVVW